jgi:lipoprotein-anchoring transpeptidase ErfK/SrfK
VVFDKSAQRVWLVEAHDDTVLRTYAVSGSVTDNLHPGSYAVYSRSLHAVGVDESGTMQYMVRFAHGANAAIGFHDIPVKDGHLVQSRADLGTPESHGCIRQWRPDAQALWRFAPLGTTVVVVA